MMQNAPSDREHFELWGVPSDVNKKERRRAEMLTQTFWRQNPLHRISSQHHARYRTDQSVDRVVIRSLIYLIAGQYIVGLRRERGVEAEQRRRRCEVPA